MTDKIHVHLEQEREWDDKALAYTGTYTDSVYVIIDGLVLNISPAEIHDWRYAGGDADYAKWLALHFGTEGDE